MKLSGARRALVAGAMAGAAFEALGVVIDGGRDEPLLWHDLLTERKYAQMCRLALGGGADVVFVGCSHSVLGVDAVTVEEKLGTDRPVYNAAIYRAMPEVVQHWATNVVVPLLRPKTLVWGLSSLHLNDNGILHREIAAKYFAAPAHRDVRPVPLWRELGRRSFAARFRAAIGPGQRKETLRSLGRGVARLRRGTFTFPETNDELGPQGLGRRVERFSYLITPRLHEVVVECVVDFESGGRQAAIVRDTVRRIQAAGTRVVFNLMPITDDVDLDFPHGRADREQGERLIHELAEELGVDVIDVTGRLTDPHYFADPVHLNGLGRHEFSVATAEALAKL